MRILVSTQLVLEAFSRIAGFCIDVFDDPALHVIPTPRGRSFLVRHCVRWQKKMVFLKCFRCLSERVAAMLRPRRIADYITASAKNRVRVQVEGSDVIAGCGRAERGGGVCSDLGLARAATAKVSSAPS